MSIHVVGLGMDPDNLPEGHAALIEQAQVLVGGRRQLAVFEDHPGEKVLVTAPLEAVFERIAALESKAEVVVLADGDPLFFGIGNTLVREFGVERVRVLPNVSSLQTAAARLGAPLHEMAGVSLHGRSDAAPLYAALMRHKWVGVLTDEKSIPSALAQALMDKGADYLRMWVFENLEGDEERVQCLKLTQACDMSFSRLNLVLFERVAEPEGLLCLGIDDEEFQTHKGVITKGPVRAAGIAALRLRPGNLLWDMGAGCGAVSIEASALLYKGASDQRGNDASDQRGNDASSSSSSGLVLAIEKNAERVACIRANAAKFGALQVEVLRGTMPECLADLPDPDRAFIGGGIGPGKESPVLDAACERLKPGGVLVAHCVLLESLELVRARLAELGWSARVTLVQAGRSGELGQGVRLEGLNPVFIVAAEKPAEQ